MAKDYLLSWINSGNFSIPTNLLKNYKNIGLSETEFVLVLHLFNFNEKGNDFPTPSELSSLMTLSESDCGLIMSQLIKKDFITIIEGVNDSGIRYEKYSLEPLYKKLVNNFLKGMSDKKLAKSKNRQADLYTTFEQEFGRPLSPYECETLTIWIDEDEHSEEIIKAALREAVISARLNFRYIDRILFDWKRNGITTVEQARAEGKRFRSHQKQQPQLEKPQIQQSVPFYNWLEQ